jgi:MFS transporter, PAT family, beta-lactamase induction signal transducer AmpG
LKLVLLALLYLVEGLPFGLQTQALPLLLRERGVSLAFISLLGVLSLPWLFKPLWAPLVDRYGTRRRWILAMLGAMAASCWLGTVTLVPAILCLNVFAATLDIAVDGLAIDLLAQRELGFGNTAQVVGYKAGMLLGGAVLGSVAAGSRVDPFAIMAAIVGALLLGLAFVAFPERARPSERDTVKDILQTLGRAIATPTGAWVIACVATYKLGESLVDPMFKLYVRDAGFGIGTVLRWTAVYGMTASIAGSFAGGYLATRLPFRRALFLAAALRLGPLVAQWIIASRPASADAIVLAIVGENFFGGALTTVMFAFMMSRVDRRIGATHYTVLAAIEVLGKMPASTASGWIAGAFGYAPTFAAGALLSGAYLVLLFLGPRGELEPA